MSETTVIGKGITIQGEISGAPPIEVLGNVNGKARSDSSVHVRSGGKVVGEIAARHVVVEGEVEAKIDGEQKVELRAGAKMLGDIATKSLIVLEGAVIDGRIHMADKR
jgi:cytoskeletal protein CcmA (bactofilin family)